MSIRRLKQIEKCLTENKNVSCRVEVQNSLKLLRKELQLQNRLRRLKQIKEYLTENKDVHCRVEVQNALKLIDEEIQSQDRSGYFKKYYEENKDTILENNRIYHRKKMKEKKEMAK